MTKWTPPPPPRHQSLMVTISDMMLVKSDPSVLAAQAEKWAMEVTRDFTQPVWLETFQDPATRGVNIRVTTQRPYGQQSGSGIDPGRTDRVADAFKMCVGAGAQRTSPTYRSGQSISWTSPKTRNGAHVNVTLGGNMTVTWGPVAIPTPPPAPEPMWSPQPVYGFRRWSVSASDGVAARPARNLGDVKYTAGTLLGRVEPWVKDTMTAECHETTLSMDAVLAGHAPEGHDAPHWGCHCGIYVTDDPEHESVRASEVLIPYDASGFSPFKDGSVKIPFRCTAVGLVALTGTVIEHEQGARGEKGRVVKIWVDEQMADLVRNRYLAVEVIPVPKRWLVIENEYGPIPARLVEEDSIPMTMDLAYRPATMRERYDMVVDQMRWAKKTMEEQWLK